MKESKARSPRTLLQRVKEIFEIINREDEPFPKSKLIEAKLNPEAAEKWLDLIAYIQNQPRIRIIKTKHNTVVEKIEGKYSVMSLKSFLNEDLPIEARWRSLEGYASSIITKQRLSKSDNNK